MIFTYEKLVDSESLIMIKAHNKALDSPYHDSFTVEEIFAVMSAPNITGSIYIRLYKIEFVSFNFFQGLIKSLTVEALKSSAELWHDKVGKKGLLTNKFKSLQISRKSVMKTSQVTIREEDEEEKE